MRSRRRWKIRSPSTCAPMSQSVRSCPGASTRRLIAALAMRHNPDLITFTTGFEREGYSEVDVAAESAEAIGARHVVRVVGPPRSSPRPIPEIVWYLDDPVADPSLVPFYFIAKEARKHVKVVLSGEGADELFGGYTIYREPLSLAPFERLPAVLRRAAGDCRNACRTEQRGKSLLQRGSLTLEQRYYGNARSFNDVQLRSVLREFRPEWTHQDVTAPIYAPVVRVFDPVARMQHLDLFTWLRGDILVKADKMTMANSWNSGCRSSTPRSSRSPNRSRWNRRSPSRQPNTHYVGHWTALSRRMCSTGRSWAFRCRFGIGCAAASCSTGQTEVIAESQTDHLLDKGAIKGMLDDHREGRSDHSRRLWTLLVFMIWHGIFVEQRIVPDIQEPVYPVSL